MPDTTAVLYAATLDRDFSDCPAARHRAPPAHSRGIGRIGRRRTRAISARPGRSVKSNLEPTPQQTDHCFTVINYGTDFVLKLYRKLEDGINPGREVPEFLCEHTSFAALPRGAGLARLPRLSR